MSVETTKTTPTTMSEKIVDRLGDVVVAGLEATAQISLGQGLLRVADKFLWVVEKSAQWSLPVQEVDAEENGKTFGKIELVRPLPWIFFLPSLVILRACRIGVNVGSLILGYPQLQTTGMVKFIQKSRRRLRTIKSNGLRNMRYRKGYRNKDDELNEAKKSLIKSMLSTLSALSCLETSRRTPSPTPTRVYVQRSEPESTPTPEEKSTTESTSPQVDPKRKYSEVVGLDDSESELQFEEESTIAKLERLAAQDSEADDRDFDSPAEEESDSSYSGSSSEEDDDDDYISESEINELHKSVSLTKMAKVIVEEPEPEPEPERKPEEHVNKVSSSNTMPEEKIMNTLQVSDDKDDISNFYSPISSPGNSIRDFTSPIDDDVKQSILSDEHLNLKNTTGLKILSDLEATIETVQLDNGGLNSFDKSSSSSALQKSEGISPEEVIKSTNGTIGEEKLNEKGNINVDTGNNSAAERNGKEQSAQLIISEGNQK